MPRYFPNLCKAVLLTLALLTSLSGCDQGEPDTSDVVEPQQPQAEPQQETQAPPPSTSEPAPYPAAELRSALSDEEKTRPDPKPEDEDEADEPADDITLSDETRRLIALVITQAQGGSREIDSFIQGFAGLRDSKLHQYGKMHYDERYKSDEILKEGPYVERAGKLAKSILALGKRDFPYTVSVVESDAINAFATAGGYIYLHTALMDALNDEQLMFVIGHEVGHIELKHTDSVFTYANRLGLLAGDNVAWIVAALLSQHVGVGYSEDQELESDKWGLINTRQFGVNGDHAIATFEILAKSAGKSVEKEEEPDTVLEELKHQRDQHYRTHPASHERIEQIKRLSSEK